MAIPIGLILEITVTAIVVNKTVETRPMLGFDNFDTVEKIICVIEAHD